MILILQVFIVNDKNLETADAVGSSEDSER